MFVTQSVCFDIEAGGLKSPFDQVICCAFKPYHEPAYVISRKPEDTDDKDLCIKIRDELEKYDHLISYNGLGYDKAFISGRLLKHGQKPLRRQLHTDCYRLAKSIFRWSLHSLRLVVICEHLGISGKTRVEPSVWERFKYDAVNGKQEALFEITGHCLQDVISLEASWDKCFKHAVVSISLR